MDSLNNCKHSKELQPILSSALKENEHNSAKIKNTSSTTEIKNDSFANENEGIIKNILDFALDRFQSTCSVEDSDQINDSENAVNVVDISTSEQTTSSVVTKKTLSLFCQNELKDMLQNILKRNLKSPNAHDESLEAVRTLSQNLSNLSLRFSKQSLSDRFIRDEFEKTIQACESCILTIYRNNSMLKVISQTKSEVSVNEEDYFEAEESFETKIEKTNK